MISSGTRRTLLRSGLLLLGVATALLPAACEKRAVTPAATQVSTRPVEMVPTTATRTPVSITREATATAVPTPTRRPASVTPTRLPSPTAVPAPTATAIGPTPVPGQPTQTPPTAGPTALPTSTVNPRLLTPTVIPPPTPRSGAPVTYSVGVTYDAVDVAPGDGQCADSQGNCTLRAAIMETNAVLGADTITLDASVYQISITGNRDDYSYSDDLDITDDLTILGKSMGLTIVDGGGIRRVFHTLNDATVEFAEITIRNGDTNGSGQGGGLYVESGRVTLRYVSVEDNLARQTPAGGIYNEGELTLINSVVTRNRADSILGGGIRSRGDLTLINSQVFDNRAPSNGGGIAISGTATIVDSAVSGNNARAGGGISVEAASSLEISRSSVSDNIGSGILVLDGGIVHASNLTVSGNSNATVAAGIRVETGGRFELDSGTVTKNGRGGISTAIGGVASIVNTIVAGNHFWDCAGIINSQGHNLIGDNGGCLFVSTAGDIVGAPDRPVDPGLMRIEELGPNSPLYVPYPSSPAYDAGGTSLDVDQRGAPRPECGGPDIGAYEMQGPDGYCLTTAQYQTVTTSIGAATSITLQARDADGDPLEYTLRSLPVFGTLSQSGSAITSAPFVLDGPQLSYMSDPGKSGADYITFGASDGYIDSATATVTVRVFAHPVITKTTDSDDGVCDGDCSLREAIAVASPGETITVPQGIYTLSLGAELLIDKELTLRGSGSETTVVQASESSGTSIARVFNVTASHVSIEKLTIKNGNASTTGNRGGGVLNSGILGLTDVIVTGNRGGERGGGISNDGGILTVSGSSIKLNTALHGPDDARSGAGGAGVHNDAGQVTVTGSEISGNSSGKYGGGIFNAGLFQVSDSNIDGNAGEREGGGIYNGSGTMTITGSTVSENTVTWDFGGTAGAIMNTAELVLVDTEIRANYARSVGGIRNTRGTVTATELEIIDNTDEYGSGLVSEGGPISLTDSTIGHNGHAGLRSDDTVMLLRTTITDNGWDSDGLSGNSDGVNLSEGTFEIIDSVISGNTGAGISSRGDLTVRGTSVTGNSGVGLFNNAYLKMDETTISDNMDGGIWLSYPGVAEITNSTVNGNFQDRDGAGIFTGAMSLSLTNVTISGNASESRGGGLHIDGGLVSLVNVTIVGNTAETGGGIHNERVPAENITLINTIVADNTEGGDCVGELRSLGHNLDSDGTCQLSQEGDLSGQDSGLGELSDNGGETYTHGLGLISPAIDAGDSDGCPDIDQRGVTRPQGAVCDIGAVESAND